MSTTTSIPLPEHKAGSTSYWLQNAYMTLYNQTGRPEICDLINFRVQRLLLDSTASKTTLSSKDASRMTAEDALAYSIYQDSIDLYKVMQLSMAQPQLPATGGGDASAAPAPSKASLPPPPTLTIAAAIKFAKNVIGESPPDDASKEQSDRSDELKALITADLTRLEKLRTGTSASRVAAGAIRIRDYPPTTEYPNRDRSVFPIQGHSELTTAEQALSSWLAKALFGVWWQLHRLEQEQGEFVFPGVAV